MPRDLLADRNTLDTMPQLEREHQEPSISPPTVQSPTSYTSTALVRSKQMDKIYPFVQLLNAEDLDDCDWLEHAAFDPVEAATREKIDYRLHTSGELCSGLFTSGKATAPLLGALLKTRTFPSIDSTDTDRKRILLGHVIATKHAERLVTDEAMDYPKDWKERYQLSPPTGHNEDGETVCIHSLCIHPQFQGKGFGKILLRSYVQRIKDSGVAKRVSLICRQRYIPFYVKAGFTNVGPSKCQYGGGGWVDMVLEFEDGGVDDGQDGY